LFLQLNLEMRQAVTISFEPMIVGCKITLHKQLMVLNSAAEEAFIAMLAAMVVEDEGCTKKVGEE
jgi:hypothetical protein